MPKALRTVEDPKRSNHVGDKKLKGYRMPQVGNRAIRTRTGITPGGREYGAARIKDIRTGRVIEQYSHAIETRVKADNFSRFTEYWQHSKLGRGKTRGKLVKFNHGIVSQEVDMRLTEPKYGRIVKKR
jgi:hypothetical protein